MSSVGPDEALEKNSREITITFKRPKLSTSLAVLLSLTLIAIVVTLTVFESLRDVNPVANPEPSPTVLEPTTQEPTTTPTPEATPSNELVPPPVGEPGRTFAMPDVVEKNAIEAANLILQAAPGAALQFVDTNGLIVEARNSYTVVATSPAAGELTPISSFITLTVTAD